MIRLVALLLLLAFPARAAPLWPQADLYQARTIVTGTRAETRADGIVTCFRRVLVKVSGDPTLLDDPRAAPLDALAAGMVEDIAYQDRMSDTPHHDEQGTRDRPFDLAVHFAPARIDAALTLLGTAPFRGRRPPILVRITVDSHGDQFPLTADAEPDEQQREALIAASDRLGLRVILPPAGPALPNAATLTGRLAWSDQDFGWVGTWHLDWNGTAHDWHIAGVSFDEAFRSAMAGSLAAFAGHQDHD